jgi:hypothetical protein
LGRRWGRALRATHDITGAFSPDLDGFACRPQRRASAAAMEWRWPPIVGRDPHRAKGRDVSLADKITAAALGKIEVDMVLMIAVCACGPRTVVKRAD